VIGCSSFVKEEVAAEWIRVSTAAVPRCADKMFCVRPDRTAETSKLKTFEIFNYLHLMIVHATCA
jgi:hypothetical protein